MTSEEATEILTKLIKWCGEFGLEGPVYLSADELEAIKVLLTRLPETVIREEK